MSVSPAERDALRERAFALAARRVPYRQIAAELGINKSTVVEYVREERQRRSHDRDAEDAIRDAVTSLRYILADLHEQYGRIEGTTPHSMYARAKVAEAIRRGGRDLIGLYNVVLPETDPEIVSIKRMLAMTAREFPTPGGYPAVGEQAVLDRAYPDDEDDDPGYFFKSDGPDY
jgi:predicted transcriptional regulator